MKNLDQIDILELIPQRPPFIMVGKITQFNQDSITTSTIIAEDNIFVEHCQFLPYGIIENMAQTCAAKIGYVNKYILKEEIQIGFIGAIRNLEIFSLPKVGEQLTTTISIIEEIFGMSLVKAESRCGNSIVATATMKIAVQKSGK